MSTTTSIRLSDKLLAEARQDAETFNRTLGGQVEHWARLGQALEAMPGFDQARVRAALVGKLQAANQSPDDWPDLDFTTPPAKAVAHMAQLRQKGGAVGYDEAGNYVRGLPGGGVEVVHKANDKER